MFLSNIVNMQKQTALKNGLGDVNPMPFVTMFGSCIGGSLYGVISENQWVWWSNFPGVIIGLYLCCEALAACGHRESDAAARKTLVRSLLFWLAFWALLGWAAIFVLASTARAPTVGFVSCGVIMLMYAAPLSTLATVLRTRDASSLYLPMCAIAATCTLLWTVYGFVLGDVFIWAPNGVGMCLSSVQLALIGLLPSKGRPTTAQGKPVLTAAELDLEIGCLHAEIDLEMSCALAASPIDEVNKPALLPPPSSASAFSPSISHLSPMPPVLALSPGNSLTELVLHRAHHGIVPAFGAAAARKTSAFSGATLECAICLASISGSASPFAALPGNGPAEENDEAAASMAVELRCGHRFCAPCMKRCAANDLASCPTCRHPHELDPVVLQDRLDAFRGNYQNWRKGGVTGAKGEVDDISAAVTTVLAGGAL
jgi:solute carrier family 50 protein (sugar transporter)